MTIVVSKEQDAFDEMFAYNEQGRIVRQARGADKDKLAGAGYVYISHTNKLLAVTPGGGGELDKRFPAVSYQHFEYDAEGNMTKDYSKDLTIAYDWRSMPVEFKRFCCTTKGSTVCDSVKLVMAYAVAAGGLARISGGYELGLFGMEGRGVYAGGTVAGLHGEWSRNGGTSWGFEERVYYGIGNNTKIDGSAASIVRQELWFPTLGKLGHLTFGTSYDVSSAGLDDVEYKELKNLIKNAGNDYAELFKDVNKAGSVKGFGKDLANRVNAFLLSNGFERNDHIGKHEKGSEKRTYRRVGSSEYGNLEIIIRSDGSTYSSYNYGNNYLLHYLIDYRGWKGRGY